VSLTTTPYTPRYWKGGLNFSWSTVSGPVTNWSTVADGSVDAGAVPSSLHTVIFSATNAPFTSGSQITTTLDAPFTVDSLQFLSAPGGVTSVLVNPGTGGTLTLAPFSTSGGIFVDSNAGNITIATPMTLTKAQTWKVDGTGFNGSSLTITGTTAFNAAATKTGNGTLTLSGTSTGTGAFNLTEGTLNINNNNALGTGILTINPSTFLDNTSAGLVTLATNNVQVWNGNFTFTGTQNLNLGTGAVTLGNSTILTVAGNTLTVTELLVRMELEPWC
jgi:autotransporter-associated beta strand protein